jgi:uncharacterized membrane protein YfcA
VHVGALAISLLVFASFAAGVVDAIAGGGGLITVPALLAAGLPPHLALGTNKGQAAFGATASFVSFWSRGGIDRHRALAAFVAGGVGSLSGAALVLAVRPEPLRPIVLVLLLAAAVVVVMRERIRPVNAAVGSAADRIEAPTRAPSARDRIVLIVASFSLGAYDGFFGPGVGSMLIVAFVLLFGDSLTRASGNAKVVNWASNLAALALFGWRGTVLWSVALPMAAANALGAFVGARLALRRGDRLVRVVVLSVVGGLVLKLGWDLVK